MCQAPTRAVERRHEFCSRGCHRLAAQRRGAERLVAQRYGEGEEVQSTRMQAPALAGPHAGGTLACNRRAGGVMHGQAQARCGGQGNASLRRRLGGAGQGKVGMNEEGRWGRMGFCSGGAWRMRGMGGAVVWAGEHEDEKGHWGEPGGRLDTRGVGGAVVLGRETWETRVVTGGVHESENGRRSHGGGVGCRDLLVAHTLCACMLCM